MQDKPHLQAIRDGEEIGFRVVSARRCIGYRPPGAESLFPCPDEVRGISASQCEECFKRAKILPCLRCDGEMCRNPVRRPSCVRPDNHAVYLASFGHGILKVGVARWERRFDRVAEQGARAALVIARDDGQIVRRVEQTIRRLGIPDRVSTGVKLGALTQVGRRPELEAELLDAVTGLRRRLRAKWLDEPEVVELASPRVLPHRPRLLSPEAGLAVKGTVRHTIGKLVIIDSDADELVAIDVGSLDGYELAPLSEAEHGSGQMALALAA